MNEEREIKTSDGMGIFGRYLTVWVTLCIIIGVMIGKWVPSIPQTLSKFEYAKVSIWSSVKKKDKLNVIKLSSAI